MQRSSLAIINTSKHHDGLEAHLKNTLPGIVIKHSHSKEQTAWYLQTHPEKNIIIGVGGDGTNNSIVTALANTNQTDKILGFLPNGTGNDFTRTIGLRQLDDYLAAIAKTIKQQDTHVQRCDIGIFTLDDHARSHYFLNSLGAGYFASVNKDATKDKRYTLAAIKRQWTDRQKEPSQAHIYLDNKREAHGTFVSLELMNGQYFGNGMQINPHGNPYDGKLELFGLKTLKTIPFYSSLASVKLRNSKHLQHRNVTSQEDIKHLRMIWDYAQDIEYDGEVHPRKAWRIDAKIYEKKLRIITP